MRCLVAGLLCLSLVGCASAPQRPPAYYVVQSGDTLYAIAWRYGLEWHELARWNGLGEAARLEVGQRLVLRAHGRQPQARRTAASRAVEAVVPPAVAGPPPFFIWPVPGRVLGEQGQPSGGFGLRLEVSPGEVVRAAADGRVAYVGAGLRAYGQLVIIKHPAGWLSAYGYNRVPRVKEGDLVQHGQVVAEAGEGPLPDGGMAPQLYFEIRRLGRAVDPRPLLPAR